jgi:hypothetical protein
MQELGETDHDVRAGRCDERLGMRLAEVEEARETRTAGPAFRVGWRKARVQWVVRANGVAGWPHADLWALPAPCARDDQCPERRRASAAARPMHQRAS